MKFHENKEIPSIGDLVTLSSNFKKARYNTGVAPIYQWVIGHRGYIVVGRLSSDQTAVVTRVMPNGPPQQGVSHKNALKLITDSGDVGWFCEGESWLIKN